MNSVGTIAYVAVCAMAALALAGCPRDVPEIGDETGSPTDAPVSACVSIPPQAFLLERIGGERIVLEVLVGPGQSPHTYEPTPAQMVALERADLYFRIGVSFEDTLIGRIEQTMPALEIVDLRDNIELRHLPTHAHGPDQDHVSHGEKDPHIWLDPKLMTVQARTVADALSRADPDGADLYEGALNSLIDDIEQLDETLHELLAPVRGRQMFVFHPAFGYFAEAYGLEQVAIEVEGKEPGARQLQGIVEQARDREVKAIFVQPEFSQVAARAVAREIGAEVVIIDPLARDYLQNMHQIARKVSEALGGERGGGDG